METIQSAANQFVVTVVIALIGLLATYATYGIRKLTERVKAQTAQLKNEESRRLLNNALQDVEKLTVVTVSAIEQTTAKSLRELVKDGKASREELLALGKQAFDEVKAATLPDVQKVITDNLGNFDNYLTKLIENAVRRVKLEDSYITLPGEVLVSNE
jgi:type II secretory pathway pseudopilin PulG